MKKVTILSLVIAVAATISLSAADAGGKKQGKGGPIPADLLKKYDKNGDGKVDKNDNLTKEEMKAFREERKKAAESTPAPTK